MAGKILCTTEVRDYNAVHDYPNLIMSAIANMRSAMRPITLEVEVRWMEPADIGRLRELEDENRRLKQMYADLSLENRALKDVIAKNRACAAVALERSVYHNRSRPKTDGPMVKLLELAWRRPEQGFGKLFKRLRRMGHGWNHKRVYRIYCSLKLNKKRKAKDVADKMSFTSGGA